jgi:heat shock protein HslJ
MKTAPLLIILGLLTGCSLTKLHTGQEYIVEWIGERPLIDRSHLTLQLDAEQQRVHGFAGCNQWFGNYRLDGERLSISHIASTRKACAPALMEQENRYLQALPKVERWDFSEHGQLQLWPAEGAAIRLWPKSNNQ